MWIEHILFYRFVYHGWESTMSEWCGVMQLEKRINIFFKDICIRSRSIAALLITLYSFKLNYGHMSFG